MKLSMWAKTQGLAYGTALRWFHEGNLPMRSEQLASGTILVHPHEDTNSKIDKTFIYARVSSSPKKIDLTSQAELCEQYCAAKGWSVDKVFKEIASGMNDNRPKLNKILEAKNCRVICLHKDRLTRFGFNYIHKLIAANGGALEVINAKKTNEDDLLKDFVAIITSFCCRLYGARRGQSKALHLKEELKK